MSDGWECWAYCAKNEKSDEIRWIHRDTGKFADEHMSRILWERYDIDQFETRENNGDGYDGYIRVKPNPNGVQEVSSMPTIVPEPVGDALINIELKHVNHDFRNGFLSALAFIEANGAGCLKMDFYDESSKVAGITLKNAGDNQTYRAYRTGNVEHLHTGVER